MDALNIYENNKKAKSKKRKHLSPPPVESEDDLSSKKSKRKHKKKCKKKHKSSKDKEYKKVKSVKNSSKRNKEDLIGPEIPNVVVKKAQLMAPMSKDEWDKRQKIIHRVYDEETGRTRLVRGQGEIIEEIVSKERHQEINRQATQGDGKYFQSTINKKVK